MSKSAPRINDNDRRWCRALGRTVVQRRRYLNLTQEDLAPRLELSVSALSVIERGTVATNIAVVIRLARALELSLPEFWVSVGLNFESLYGREYEPARLGRPSASAKLAC